MDVTIFETGNVVWLSFSPGLPRIPLMRRYRRRRTTPRRRYLSPGYKLCQPLRRDIEGLADAKPHVPGNCDVFAGQFDLRDVAPCSACQLR